MDNDSTDLIISLYRDGEITEYAARTLVGDEAFEDAEGPEGMLDRDPGQSISAGALAEWPDDVPLPYGHLPKEEYYVDGALADDD